MIDERGDKGEDIEADEGKDEDTGGDVNTIRVRVMGRVKARMEIRIRVRLMVGSYDEDGCEDDSENTDEIEDVDEAERKGLTVGRLKCRCT
jgi:hypothetical protein